MNFPWHLFRKNLRIHQNEIMIGFCIYQKRPYPTPRSANYPLHRRTVSEGETVWWERPPRVLTKARARRFWRFYPWGFDGRTSSVFRLGLKACFRKVLDDEVFSEEGSRDSERCVSCGMFRVNPRQQQTAAELSSTSENVLSSLKGKSATSGSLGMKQSEQTCALPLGVLQCHCIYHIFQCPPMTLHWLYFPTTF